MKSGFNQGFELSTSGGWKTYCDFTGLPATSYSDATTIVDFTFILKRLVVQRLDQ